MAQLLVQVVSVNNLAAGAQVSVPHSLESNGVAVAPTLVIPDRSSSIAVKTVTTTNVTFVNDGTSPATANFRLERGWQPELDASTVTPLLWAGGGGTGAPGVMTKVFSLTTQQLNVAANTSGPNPTFFTAGNVVLPANTLAVGSTVTFRISGTVQNTTGAGLNTTVDFYADADGVTPGTGLLATTGVVASIANASNFVIVANATIKATGANVGALGGVTGTYGQGAGGLNLAGTNDTANGINTQATITLATGITFSVANNLNNFTINNYEVYVAR